MKNIQQLTKWNRKYLLQALGLIQTNDAACKIVCFKAELGTLIFKSNGQVNKCKHLINDTIKPF